MACLGAAALVGIFLSRWVTQPLAPMRRAAVRLGHGDLTARVGPGPGPPEVQEVATAFDEMAGRLEQLVDAQEAFVADASHQLRTPLTALRLRLENLETEIAGADAQDDLAGARRETQRLSRLIDGLLTLARADRGTDWSERQVLEVQAATDERIDTWRPIAEECDVELVGEPSDLRVDVSPDRLAQVLDNLLANATDASPRGTRLRLFARRSPDGRWVEIHVVDQGPGLDPEQRRRAFDRFWRTPTTGADRRRRPAESGGQRAGPGHRGPPGGGRRWAGGAARGPRGRDRRSGDLPHSVTDRGRAGRGSLPFLGLTCRPFSGRAADNGCMDARTRSRGLARVNRLTGWLAGGAVVVSGAFVALLAHPQARSGAASRPSTNPTTPRGDGTAGDRLWGHRCPVRRPAAPPPRSIPSPAARSTAGSPRRR